jgi:hypothetical protein
VMAFYKRDACISSRRPFIWFTSLDGFLFQFSLQNIPTYIYIYVCVCVCYYVFSDREELTLTVSLYPFRQLFG